MAGGDYDKQHDIAVDYLTREGFRVLDRDWHGSAHGTAEIVATEPRTLVLVCAGPGPIPRELAPSSARRLRRIAVDWMTAHSVSFDQVRVDMISVTLLPMGQSNLEHVRGMA